MDIVLNGIRKSYGDRIILADYSDVFEAGQVHAIMAPSGRGKTTLLRLILGLEPPDEGNITGVPERKAAVFQENRLCPGLSVLGNIRAAVGRSVSTAKIQVLLGDLGLSDSALLPARHLSGGMARRAALARALLYGADLLALDEPFAGLDEENRQAAGEAILRHAAGKTVLLVTHRPEDAELLHAVHLHILPP